MPLGPPPGLANAVTRRSAARRNAPVRGTPYAGSVTALESLAESTYVLLTTFRRDGRPVPTPVWAVRDGDALVVWTVADSGKVKRIRRDGSVTVAPCTARGRPLGEAVAGRATLTGPVPHDRRVRALFGRKYGLFGRLVMLGSRIRRGREGTVGVRITVAG